MNLHDRWLVALLAVGLTCGVCQAVVTTVDRGAWPESWPEELEPFRRQAKTVGVAHGIQETVYEIPFARREEFEKAWPQVLKLKSDGAPLILEKSPSTYPVSGSTMRAGVRVLWPSGGTVKRPDGTRLQASPPWPDSIKSASGELPEYVVAEGGKWVAAAAGRCRGFRHRARVDVVLVVDGQVVDLNRIELPGDTPVLDRRFKKPRGPDASTGGQAAVGGEPPSRAAIQSGRSGSASRRVSSRTDQTTISTGMAYSNTDLSTMAINTPG